MSLTQSQISALKADWQSGPLAAQVAPFLKTLENGQSQDPAIATIYNSSSGKSVTLPVATKGSVLSLVQLALVGVLSAPSQIQQKWLAVAGPLTTLLAGGPDFIDQASVASTFQGIVADGLLTADQAKSPWTRVGTYIEIIPDFGAGFVLSDQAVGEVRNS